MPKITGTTTDLQTTYQEWPKTLEPPKLTFLAKHPSLNHLGYEVKASANNRQHIYWVNLEINDVQRQQLNEKRKQLNVTNTQPDTASFPHLRNLYAQGLHPITGLDSQGYDIELRRPDLTKPGTLHPHQLFAKPETLPFPGTQTQLDANVSHVFKTEVEDIETGKLSIPKFEGTVIAYHLNKTYSLHRQVDYGQISQQSNSPVTSNDEKRTLFIQAHGFETRAKTVAMPPGLTFEFYGPSGQDLKISEKTPPNSQIVEATVQPYAMAKVRKNNGDLVIALLQRCSEDVTDGQSVFDNVLGPVTERAGNKHISDILLNKSGGGRNESEYKEYKQNYDAAQPRNETRNIPLQKPLSSSYAFARERSTHREEAITLLNLPNTDILTLEKGKTGSLGDLIEEIKKLNILDQYKKIALPVCRSNSVTPPNTGWNTSNNKPISLNKIIFASDSTGSFELGAPPLDQERWHQEFDLTKPKKDGDS